MSEYRRWYVPGGTYFFTVVTHQRRRILVEPRARKCLREAISTIREDRPFELVAIVLLPDHLHAIWTLPPGDDDFSTRWKRIKEEFTRSYLNEGGQEGKPTLSRLRRGERGVWQRRFRDHVVRDDDDFENHFHYLHYNPVKHRLVRAVREWPYSSFHRFVAQGIYPGNWGEGPITFDRVDESAVE